MRRNIGLRISKTGVQSITLSLDIATFKCTQIVQHSPIPQDAVGKREARIGEHKREDADKAEHNGSTDALYLLLYPREHR